MHEDVKGQETETPGKSTTFSITAQSKQFTASQFFCITELWFADNFKY